MMKIGLGMKQELHMAPILKLTVPLGQFRPALKLGESICVFGPKNRDAQNELGNGMACLCARDSGVAADLDREIDQRNHDANRADDLSKIGEVVEIHVSQLVVVGQALRLLKPKMATDAVALQFQLTFVLRGIEMASRFCDKAVVAKFPKLVAADPNVFCCSCICAGQRPVEGGSVRAWVEFVEGDGHVRKIPHEYARDFQSRSRRSAVHCQRGILGEERGYAFRILTAPRFCVAHCEVV